jgi:osmotically-inducible protein OsmY
VNKQANFVSGLIVGAGLMYVLDPARGKRRRALLRDQMVHAAHELEDVGERTAGKSQDLRNRARGAVAETRTRLRREDVDDSVLEARVRAEIGRVVSNPGAIQVAAEEGHVTLSGPVLEHEVEELLSSASSVRGVGEVENRLDPHAEPGDVPGLQGTAR